MSMASRNNPCHFKLVLLGDTAVGKSCLVVRFVRDEFFEYQEPTIGGASRNVARFRRTSHAGTGSVHALHAAPDLCLGAALCRRTLGAVPCRGYCAEAFDRGRNVASRGGSCCGALRTAAFLTQTVKLDTTTVKFEIWDTAGQGTQCLLSPLRAVWGYPNAVPPPSAPLPGVLCGRKLTPPRTCLHHTVC